MRLPGYSCHKNKRIQKRFFAMLCALFLVVLPVGAAWMLPMQIVYAIDDKMFEGTWHFAGTVDGEYGEITLYLSNIGNGSVTFRGVLSSNGETGETRELTMPNTISGNTMSITNTTTGATSAVTINDDLLHATFSLDGVDLSGQRLSEMPVAAPQPEAEQESESAPESEATSEGESEPESAPEGEAQEEGQGADSESQEAQSNGGKTPESSNESHVEENVDSIKENEIQEQPTLVEEAYEDHADESTTATNSAAAAVVGAVGGVAAAAGVAGAIGGGGGEAAGAAAGAASAGASAASTGAGAASVGASATSAGTGAASTGTGAGSFAGVDLSSATGMDPSTLTNSGWDASGDSGMGSFASDNTGANASDTIEVYANVGGPSVAADVPVSEPVQIMAGVASNPFDEDAIVHVTKSSDIGKVPYDTPGLHVGRAGSEDGGLVNGSGADQSTGSGIDQSAGTDGGTDHKSELDGKGIKQSSGNDRTGSETDADGQNGSEPNDKEGIETPKDEKDQNAGEAKSADGDDEVTSSDSEDSSQEKGNQEESGESSDQEQDDEDEASEEGSEKGTEEGSEEGAEENGSEETGEEQSSEEQKIAGGEQPSPEDQGAAGGNTRQPQELKQTEAAQQPQQDQDQETPGGDPQPKENTKPAGTDPSRQNTPGDTKADTTGKENAGQTDTNSNDKDASQDPNAKIPDEKPPEEVKPDPKEAYMNKLMEKYGVSSKEELKKAIKIEQIKAGNEWADANRDEGKYSFLTTVAGEGEKFADRFVTSVSTLAGPQGKAVVKGYFQVKGLAVGVADAIGTICNNDKMSTGDAVLEMLHSGVKGLTSGQIDAWQNTLDAGWGKFASHAGGETLKEAWTALKEGKSWKDVSLASLKCSIKGTISGGLSWGLDKIGDSVKGIVTVGDGAVLKTFASGNSKYLPLFSGVNKLTGWASDITSKHLTNKQVYEMVSGVGSELFVNSDLGMNIPGRINKLFGDDDD